MATTTRIPTVYNLFDAYMTNTSKYWNLGTPTNAERLGISIELVDQWVELKQNWDEVYVLYNDKQNERTPFVIAKMREIISKCQALDRDNHILNLIANSNSSVLEDFETFNIKAGTLLHGSKNIPTTPISELVVPRFKPRGGGVVYIQCGNNGNTRTSIVPGSTAVEYRYFVGKESLEDINSPEYTFGYSTKASFTFSAGAVHSGEILYIYFRWNHQRHPDLAGPWSPLYQTLIL